MTEEMKIIADIVRYVVFKISKPKGDVKSFVIEEETGPFYIVEDEEVIDNVEPVDETYDWADPLNLRQDNGLASIVIHEKDGAFDSCEWIGSKFHLVPVAYYYTGDMDDLPIKNRFVYADNLTQIAYYARTDTWLWELLPLYYKSVVFLNKTLAKIRKVWYNMTHD